MSRRERGLVRWVGSKAHHVERVVPMVQAHLAETKGKLISPFYGVGHLERASGVVPARQIAAEAATELRWALQTMRDDSADSVFWALQDLAQLIGFSRRGYQRVQAMAVGPQNLALRAARFLYLQTFCWNGLWRVNADGRHNVPSVAARLRRRQAMLPTQEEIRRFAEALPSKIHSDWHKAVAVATTGDLLLVDPPFAGGFVGYTPEGFSFAEQGTLAAALHNACLHGVGVIAFNSPAADALYPWARVEELHRSGQVSSDGTKRQPVKELLFTAGLRGAQERAA